MITIKTNVNIQTQTKEINELTNVIIAHQDACDQIAVDLQLEDRTSMLVELTNQHDKHEADRQKALHMLAGLQSQVNYENRMYKELFG